MTAHRAGRGRRVDEAIARRIAAAALPDSAMTPERFNQCLATIGWSVRELARQLDVPPTRPRYWSEGRYPIPEQVAQWLERLAAAHERYPPPDL